MAAQIVEVVFKTLKLVQGGTNWHIRNRDEVFAMQWDNIQANTIIIFR